VSAERDAHQRFAELYRSLGAPILAYAARHTASPQDAADVMAEAFAVAWRRIDDVPAGDEARPWLYGVTRGVLANHHRGVRRQRRLSERVTTELAQAVQASAVTHECADGRTGRMAGGPLGDTFGDPIVLAALEALSEADRELLMLVAWKT
jgi:DNA-directed RNA polymerase specialized sigma24 family protein